MPVSAKLAEKVGIAISRAERAYLVAESKPNVDPPARAAGLSSRL
jgi:hypothetical protein